MIKETGAHGWMADFAESLPLESVLFNTSISPVDYHNIYTTEWAKLNWEAIVEAGREKDGTFFQSSNFYALLPAVSNLLFAIWILKESNIFHFVLDWRPTAIME